MGYNDHAPACLVRVPRLRPASGGVAGGITSGAGGGDGLTTGVSGVNGKGVCQGESVSVVSSEAETDFVIGVINSGMLGERRAGVSKGSILPLSSLSLSLWHVITGGNLGTTNG